MAMAALMSGAMAPVKRGGKWYRGGKGKLRIESLPPKRRIVDDSNHREQTVGSFPV